MGHGAITAYFQDLERVYQTGEAREHGYRPALRDLIEAIEDNQQLQAINEPKHIDCGAPGV